MPFPLIDPVGPHGAALDAPALRVMEQIAAAAEQVDRDGVPRGHIDALARVGLVAGQIQPVAAAHEAVEVLAGCDASTWFCWTQHASPTQALATSGDSADTPGANALRERYLAGLSAGALLAGVAFAHVRRPGPPNPVATRVDGGWRIDGTLDWVTSWDIADVVLVVVRGSGDDAGTLVSFVLPAGRSGEALPAGVDVGEPLQLLAMSGTHTRPITLTDVFVPDDQVVAVTDAVAWMAVDEQRTADANPAAFGLARACIAELSELADVRGDEVMAQLASSLADECREVRARAYALAEDPDRAGTRPARLQARADSLALASRAAQAVITARAGAAMLSGTPAERRLREAMFLLVQAQTADTRRAQLERQLLSGQ